MDLKRFFGRYVSVTGISLAGLGGPVSLQTGRRTLSIS